MMKKRVRFINFLIDSFTFLVIAMIISFAVRDFIPRSSLKFPLITLYYLYYFLLELSFGQTVGKFITHTKVVGIDNEHPGISGIFFRTLARLIPIDFVSYLFTANGFHDSLSKTKLIIKPKIN